jgi:hypothetical protein
VQRVKELHSASYTSIDLEGAYQGFPSLRRVVGLQVGRFESRAGAFLAGAIMADMATIGFLLWLGYLPYITTSGATVDAPLQKQKVRFIRPRYMHFLCTYS